MIDKTQLRDNLIALGVTAALASAIVWINSSKELPLKRPITGKTINPGAERMEIIKAYQKMVKKIKSDCKNDKRCQIEDGEPKIKWTNPESKLQIISELEKWIIEDDDPAIYKKVKL